MQQGSLKQGVLTGGKVSYREYAIHSKSILIKTVE